MLLCAAQSCGGDGKSPVDGAPNSEAGSSDDASVDLGLDVVLTPDTAGAQCPGSVSEGESCSPSGLACGGSGESGPCNDTSPEAPVTCGCESGTWSCPNPYCADYCPSSLSEADGTSCDPSQGTACYYRDFSTGGLVSCHCSNGTVTCPQ